MYMVELHTINIKIGRVKVHGGTLLPTDVSESSIKVWLILQQVYNELGRTSQLA